jgi:hypothetical protein
VLITQKPVIDLVNNSNSSEIRASRRTIQFLKLCFKYIFRHLISLFVDFFGGLGAWVGLGLGVVWCASVWGVCVEEGWGLTRVKPGDCTSE